MENTDIILSEVKKILSFHEAIINFNEIFSAGKRKEKSRFYLIVNTNQRDLFVKYAPQELDDIFKSEYDALNQISFLKILTPQPISLIKKGIVISVINGQSIEKILIASGLESSSKLLSDFMLYMAQFHKERRALPKIIDRCKIYQEVTGREVLGDTKRLVEQMNIGFTHGDLDPFNTIYNSNSGQFGLIDWEDFNEHGIQEFDAIHFVVMLGVITNPNASQSQLYQIIFTPRINNIYLNLLLEYSVSSASSLDLILQLLPAYCDAQNLRLLKAGRDNRNFLYNKFKELYYAT